MGTAPKALAIMLGLAGLAGGGAEAAGIAGILDPLSAEVDARFEAVDPPTTPAERREWKGLGAVRAAFARIEAVPDAAYSQQVPGRAAILAEKTLRRLYPDEFAPDAEGAVLPGLLADVAQGLLDDVEGDYVGLCAHMPGGVSGNLSLKLAAGSLRKARIALDAAAAALEDGAAAVALKRIVAADVAIGSFDSLGRADRTVYPGVGAFVGRTLGYANPADREGSDPGVLDIDLDALGAAGEFGRLHLVLPLGAEPGRYALGEGDATWLPAGEEVPWTLVGGWIHVLPAGLGAEEFVAAFEFDVTDGARVLKIRCGGVAF